MNFSRRDLFRGGRDAAGLLAVSAVLRDLGIQMPVAAADGALRVGPDVYESIGVKPLINARGTFTIISGSLMLPEVRAAIDAAAKHYVHMDELMDKVGARLAALTGAEWGMVSSGCSAAITHATSACVAGGNPDLHIRIPNLTGFAKDEVIIPKHSRNVYDAAVRAVGVRVREVTTPVELQAAIGPRTAMIYILAGPAADQSELNTKTIADIAKATRTPILVDAAAEILTIPNVHLQNGATLVAYSGGKCLRGPQSAGLLLGRKDLVRAAWVHSAPHHGFARAMKVGKEEAIGMLMAVEMWVKRDHDAEWKRWTAALDHIARHLSSVDGVTTSVSQPQGLSNRTPSLRITWDRERFGLSGDDVVRTLLQTEPRIAMAAGGGGGRADQSRTGVSVTPYMMSPGEEVTVADRLHAVLTSAKGAPSTKVAASAADLSGQWNVRITYLAGASNHVLFLKQSDNALTGTHQGDFVTRDLNGSIRGSDVQIRSNYTEQHGDALSFTFTGKIDAKNKDEMSGTLDMGEYLNATWSAKRYVQPKA